MMSQAGHVPQQGVRDARGLEALCDLLGGAVTEGPLDLGLQLRAVLHARGVPDESRVDGECRLAEDPLTEHGPLALVLKSEEDLLAVPATERPVRSDGCVSRPGPLWWRAAVHGVVERIAHPFGERLQHRDLDRDALICPTALDECGEDAAVRVHARGDVRDGDADLRRLVLGAGDGDQAGLALDEQVVRLLVGIGAVAAVAGDRDVDEAGVDGSERFGAEPEPLGRARGEVLDEHVGPAHQGRNGRPAVLALEVERYRLLRPVEPDEVARQPADGLVVAAGEIAGAGTLDLDHSGSEISQLTRRERRGDGLLEGDDEESVEGVHAEFLRLSQTRVCAASREGVSNSFVKYRRSAANSG